jgi:hypothetical protein
MSGVSSARMYHAPGELHVYLSVPTPWEFRETTTDFT